VQGKGYRVLGTWSKVQGLGFGVYSFGLGARVDGSRLRVCSLGSS